MYCKILANSDSINYEKSILKHEFRSCTSAKRAVNFYEHDIAPGFLLSVMSLSKPYERASLQICTLTKSILPANLAKYLSLVNYSTFCSQKGIWLHLKI